MFRSSILLAVLAGLLSEPALPQASSPKVATRPAPSAATLAKHCQAKLDQGSPEVAEKCFRGALERFPENSVLHEGLAQTLEKQDRFDETEAEYRKADGSDSHVRISSFAERLSQRGEIDRAIRISRSIQSAFPADSSPSK